MDAIVYRLESRDFKEMEHALSAWDHRYRQISPGAFRGGLLHTQVGSLGVFRNRWERAIHYLGVAPEGTVALGLTLAQSGEGRWNGQRMGPDDMLVAGCGTEGEYLSAPLWDSVVFAIPETELTRQIAELTHDDPRDFVAHGVARLTPQAAAQVRQAARAYLDASARALARPDAPSPLAEMTRPMIELIAHALVSTQPPRSQKQSLIRQRQLIREAEAYCAHNKAQPLRIGQLCHETGLSERSLREAFHKLTGMSPLAYLKTEQLNRAYDLLRVSNPDETLVKNVALANGFTHLGQFSQDYKQLFGELPSATLQRR
jgi:AraC family ethanolamine operon transcriptional activator